MASYYFLMLAASCVLAVTTAQPPQCPQALACLNITAPPVNGDACSHFTRPMTCLAGLRDECPLNESLVAFDTVAQLAQQNCRALTGNFNFLCQDLTTCSSQTEFIQSLGAIAEDPASIMDKLLDAGFWCRYTEQISSCIISSGRSCNLTADGLQSVQAIHQELTQACRGGGGISTGGSDVCNSACQITCGEKLADCQAAWQRGSSQLGRIACANIDSAPDRCRLMQQLNSCVEENLDEKCMAVAGFETAVMSIRNETQRVCSDGSVCSAYVSKCGCKVIPEGQSRPQTDHIAAICSGWPEAKKCLRDAPEKCKTNPKTQEFIDNFRTSNAIGYYMNCAKEGGVCGKTLRCLNAFNARFGRDNNGPDAICRMTSLFDCLGNASSTCSIDQGSVTFAQIKGFVQELCNDVLPNSAKLLECPQYQECAAQAIGQAGTNSSGSSDEAWAQAHMAVSTTRTGYWCSALAAGYKCALDNAEACGMMANETTTARIQYERLTDSCAGAATVPPLNKDKYTGTDPDADSDNDPDTDSGSGAEAMWRLSERLALASTTVLLVFRTLLAH